MLFMTVTKFLLITRQDSEDTMPRPLTKTLRLWMKGDLAKIAQVKRLQYDKGAGFAVEDFLHLR